MFRKKSNGTCRSSALSSSSQIPGLDGEMLALLCISPCPWQKSAALILAATNSHPWVQPGPCIWEKEEGRAKFSHHQAWHKQWWTFTSYLGINRKKNITKKRGDSLIWASASGSILSHFCEKHCVKVLIRSHWPPFFYIAFIYCFIFSFDYLNNHCYSSQNSIRLSGGRNI